MTVSAVAQLDGMAGSGRSGVELRKRKRATASALAAVLDPVGGTLSGAAAAHLRSHEPGPRWIDVSDDEDEDTGAILPPFVSILHLDNPTHDQVLQGLRACAAAARDGHWRALPESAQQDFCEWLAGWLPGVASAELLQWGLRVLAWMSEWGTGCDATRIVPVVCDTLRNGSACEAALSLCCVVLGNLARRGPRAAAEVAAGGGGHAILAALDPVDGIIVAVAREGFWALAEIHRHSSETLPTGLLPAITAVLSTSAVHPDILDEACWCIAAVVASGYFGTKAVVECGAVPLLCERLRIETAARGGGGGGGGGDATGTMATDEGDVGGTDDWVVGSLRVIGGLAGSTDGLADAVIASGALVSLRGMVGHPRLQVRSEACRVLANLCAGSSRQLCAVVDDGVVPAILECATQSAATSAGRALRAEACWALANLLSQATSDQVCYVVTLGASSAMLSNLDAADDPLALAICKAVRRTFRVCTDLNVDFLPYIDDAADRIEDVLCRPGASPQLVTTAEELLALAALD